jgi:monothiol glutaredoxin
MAERFAAHGFGNIFNVEGGMDAWAREIDPGVPRY